MTMAAIEVRDVLQKNLDEEFHFIEECLGRFPLVSFDTEYPGTVSKPDIPSYAYSQLSPSQLYNIMRENVNQLKLIQLGLTLSDINGNLPRSAPEGVQCVWQFNFSDFDPDSDIHNSESISLLKQQGIDFIKNKNEGIDSRTFAKKFQESRSGRNSPRRAYLTWITFHGLYDYGYLIKILTGRNLPNNWEDFKMLVHAFLGASNQDLKIMARKLGLHGGLEKIANSVHVHRAAGKSHQAASDCLLTMQVFLKLHQKYFHASAAASRSVCTPVYIQHPPLIILTSPLMHQRSGFY